MGVVSTGAWRRSASSVSSGLASETVTPQPASGVLLTLEWDDSDGTHYEVDYVFDGDELRRQLNGGSPGTFIAEYIVEADTSFEEDLAVDNKYKLTIKASRGEAEVERSYVVTPRPEPSPE